MAEEKEKLDKQPVKPSVDDKYGKIDEETKDLLKRYELEYFREDKPIPFCGLLIYPVQVRHYEEFASCCTCLTLNKNEDPMGIRFSHLDYLINKMNIKENDEGKIWTYKLQRLFEIIFRLSNGIKCKNEKCNHIIKYSDDVLRNYFKEVTQKLEEAKSKNTEFEAPKLHCPECGGTDFSEMIGIIQDPQTKKNAFTVNGHIINRDDWAKLRQIVLFQNYPDYVDDSWVDPEIKKDHEEKLRLQQQKNDLHASIEKKVVCLSIATHYNCEEIYDMSIRRFTMTLTATEDLINYKIMKQAVMSGFVSLPKGQSIEHWMWKPVKDIYGDSYKDADSVQQSVSNL